MPLLKEQNIEQEKMQLLDHQTKDNNPDLLNTASVTSVSSLVSSRNFAKKEEKNDLQTITEGTSTPIRNENAVSSLSPKSQPTHSSNVSLRLFCGIAATSFGALALITAFATLNVATAGTTAGIALAVAGGIVFFSGGISLGVMIQKHQSKDTNTLSP